MSPDTSLFLLVTFWASVHDGLGLPVMKHLDIEADDNAQTHRVRTKRCACSNQQDSECHYFCHLDIIWVNTPSKTTVYGLGNSLSRRRRSTCRCTCSNPGDQTCNRFCNSSPEASDPKNSKKPLLDMLGMMRLKAFKSKGSLYPSDSDKPSDPWKKNAR